MREIFIDVVNGSDSTIKVTQNDNLTGSYKLIITENGRRLDLTDKNIKFAFVKSDNHLGDIIEDLRVTNATQGEIDFPITNRITKVDGLYSCGIAIYNSTGYLEHTGTFNLYVRENLFEKVSGELLENSAYKELMSLLDKATNLNAELNPLVTNGTALKNDLENDINQANNLKNNLETNTNRATTINDNLVKNTATAEEKNTTLNNSLNEAKKYIENLDGSQNLPQMREDITTLQNGLKSNQELAYEGQSLKCENTLDGRIEDIVLEGMTYQNLVDYSKHWVMDKWNYTVPFINKLKPNTKYTLVVDIANNTINKTFSIACDDGNTTTQFKSPYVSIPQGFNGRLIFNIMSKDSFENCIKALYSIHDPSLFTGECDIKLMILEGELESAPPYFEDFKSVAETEINLCEQTELGGIKWAEGDDYDSQNYCRSSYIPVKKGFKYSYSPIGVISNINESVGIYHYDENKVYKQEFNTTTANGWFIAKLTGFVRLENNVKDGQPIKLEELAKVKRQVNEGELLPYIPPNKNEVDILSTGKNLVNFNKPIFFNPTGKSDYYSCVLNNKTITISCDNYTPTLILRNYDENKNPIDWWSVQQKRTISDDKLKGTKFITLESYNNNAPATINKCLITYEDNNIEEYVPYQIDIRKLLLPFKSGLKGLPNGAKDIIFNKEDGCYVKQNIGKIILNGSEKWIRRTMASENNTIGFGLLGTEVSNYKLGQGLCDKFLVNKDANITWNKDVECLSNADFIQLRILKSKLETQDIEGFKKWLSQNPITVYYELAEPIETKISDTKLSLDTYNALTYVFSNNAISPNIKLKVASNLGSIIQQNAKSINDIYKLIDEVLIPQVTQNTADIAILKLK